jgi:hypothetical protein
MLRNGAATLTDYERAIPEQGVTGSPSENLLEKAPGVPATQSGQPLAVEGDGEMRGTIQFSDYSRQVAWDRFWDQMYALMLPIVAERASTRSSPSAPAAPDASKEE